MTHTSAWKTVQCLSRLMLINLRLGFIKAKDKIHEKNFGSSNVFTAFNYFIAFAVHHKFSIIINLSDIVFLSVVDF